MTWTGEQTNLLKALQVIYQTRLTNDNSSANIAHIELCTVIDYLQKIPNNMVEEKVTCPKVSNLFQGKVE